MSIFFSFMPALGKEEYFSYKKYNEKINIEEKIFEYLEERPIYISLKDCLCLAVDNNFGIRIIEKNYEAKKYNFKYTLSKFLPEVGITGYTNLIRGQVLVGGILLDEIREFALFGGLYATHNLTDGGRDIFRAKSSDYLKKSLNEKLTNTKEETLREVARKYYELLEAKLSIEIYIRNYHEREEQLRLLSNLKRAGLGTKFDVIRGENELADAKQSLLTSINNFRLKQATLANAIGISVEAPLYPIEEEIEPIQLIEENKEIEELYESALVNRKDIKALELEIESDKFKRKMNYSDFIPKIRLDYKYSYQGTANSGLGHNAQFIVNADIPIGENLGVGTWAKLKEEGAEIRAKELELINNKRNIKNEIINHYTSSKFSKERAKIGAKRIEYATETSRLAELRLNAGEGLLIDVLQTQTEKTRARISYLSMVVEYNIKQVELLYDIGQISIKNLLENFD